MLRALDQHPAVAGPSEMNRDRLAMPPVGTAPDPVDSHVRPVRVGAALLQSADFTGRLDELADRLRRDRPDVRAEATGYLREMAATRNPPADRVWSGLGRWMLRAHDVVVDQEAAARVRRLPPVFSQVARVAPRRRVPRPAAGRVCGPRLLADGPRRPPRPGAPADRRADHPAVLVVGEQDRLITPELTRRPAATIPGAADHLWPRVGHGPQVERPTDLADLVRGLAAGPVTA